MEMVGIPVSEQVVQTVADQSDTDALDLPPLFETFDPDALDMLIREMNEGYVSFEYAGYSITVDSHGAIDVNGRLQSGSTGTEAAADHV